MGSSKRRCSRITHLLPVQEAGSRLVAPAAARVAAALSGRGRRSGRGAPRCRGTLSRTTPQARAAELVSGASAEATQMMAEAIPVPGPRARERTRAAAPRARGSSTNCDASHSGLRERDTRAIVAAKEVTLSRAREDLGLFGSQNAPLRNPPPPNQS